MAKDYIQDIVPPDEIRRRENRDNREKEVRLNVQTTNNEDDDEVEIPHDDQPAVRSIRNIAPARSRPRYGEVREMPGGPPPPPRARRRVGRLWMWFAALIGLIILGILGLFAFRNTVITVVPRSHTVVFDESTKFSAYPESAVQNGMLSYTLIESDLEDSEVVATTGVEHVESKASGTVTVYNNYSATPVRLLKNTRFATPNGLIFRAPVDIVVPGKKGSLPGEIRVMVVADKVGEAYNVGPTNKFTLPGLTSSPEMYATVYARSTDAMSGGFVGEQPAVEPGALEAATAQVRGRLESKARDAAAQTDRVVFPELTRITYQSLPKTPEAGGNVRIHEKAHIEMISFARDQFAHAVAETVSAEAENASITLIPASNYAAHFQSATSSSWGSDPVTFTLSGQAQLVWDVDSGALATALAGKDESAFQTIVTGFAGIQEAHARIEPFWKNTFPEDPARIRVRIDSPQMSR